MDEMKARPIEILLSDNQESNIKKQIYKAISEAIQKARSDAGMDKMFFNKKQACKYLNVSNNTFDKYYYDIPIHDVNGLVVYSKKEINEFVFNK